MVFALMACGGGNSGGGSKIVFYSSRKLDGTDAQNANGTYNIWRVNTDGTGPTPLTSATAVGADSSEPQWSPDGSKVVFESTRKLDGTDAQNANGTYNIWRVNTDGTGLTPLTSATAVGAGSYAPQWSPDGSKVVFYSSRNLDGTDAQNRTSNIWRVNADGTGLRPITNATAIAHNLPPQLSRDGSKVVFASTRNLDGTDTPTGYFTFNIWRVNADGTGLRPITNATYVSSFYPQWSPDGSKVVFDSTRKLDGTDAQNATDVSNIWRVNADGTGLTPLTSATGAGAAFPQWSPDGSRVVFASTRNLDGTDTPNANFTSNIWRVNADGTGLRPVTNATANGAGSDLPQWSPDGSEVVFLSSRKLDGTDAPNANHTSNIWRVNTDGTGLTPLTSITANGVLSDWPSFSH
jgi:TolB protein